MKKGRRKQKKGVKRQYRGRKAGSTSRTKQRRRSSSKRRKLTKVKRKKMQKGGGINWAELTDAFVLQDAVLDPEHYRRQWKRQQNINKRFQSKMAEKKHTQAKAL